MTPAEQESHEGVLSLGGYGEIFQRNVNLSGVVPQISLIMGPCAGGAVYSPSLTDFTFMVRQTSFMFVTGPDVVKKVTYEDVTQEKLGGSTIHSKVTGVADKSFNDDLELLHFMRKFVNILPSNNKDALDQRQTNDPIDRKIPFLKHLLPANNNQTYDMKKLIYRVVDDRLFTEIQEEYAKNIIIGFATIGGHRVGIIANQPMVVAGCLDVNSSRKAARFYQILRCI